MVYDIGAMAPPLHEQIGCEARLVGIETRAINELNFLRIQNFITKAHFDASVKRVLRSAEEKAIRAGVLQRRNIGTTRVGGQP